MKGKIIYFIFTFLVLSVAINAQNNIDISTNTSNVLTKDSLKVLHIGNSFANNSTSYLSKMVEAAGIDVSDMCLYKFYRGGGSFTSFIDCWNNKDAKGYSISKVIGGITIPIKSSATPYDGANIRKAITDYKWDLIIIQQVSTYSHKYTLWNQDIKEGHLQELINIIRTYQPQAVIGANLVHASYRLGNNTDSLFHLIADSYRQFCIDFNVDFIIPYGTAIQNIRNSSINTTQYGFSNDQHHLAYGVGQYVANAAYFEALIAPRYGVSILGNKCRIEISDYQEKKAAYPDELIPVNDKNAYQCQKAAILAIHDKFNISKMEDEEVMGVVSITQKEKTDSFVYDLNGRIVNEKTMKPGIYIKNRRKVIIK